MIVKIKDKEYSFDGYVNPISSVQRLAEEIYQQGKADAIDDIFDKAYDVDMDSSLIYLRFDKEDFNVPFMSRKNELEEWLKEKLKEK